MVQGAGEEWEVAVMCLVIIDWFNAGVNLRPDSRVSPVTVSGRMQKVILAGFVTLPAGVPVMQGII